MNEGWKNFGYRCEESCIRDQCTNDPTPPEPGCFCKSPLLIRGPDGDCVSPRKCIPNPCGPNSTWKLGNECSDRCFKEEMTCEEKFHLDCFCDKGFARINDECVPIEMCTTESECLTQRNRVWSTCSNPCDQACPHINVVCSSNCIEGCFCRDGLVEVNGNCVESTQFCHEKECDCGENTEYRWGNDCSDQCGMEYLICDGPKRKGCFCAEGFRNVGGSCIPVERCPYKCPLGLTHVETGNICDNYCADTVQSCPDRAGDNTPGCYCTTARGYIPVNGVCVRKTSYCPQIFNPTMTPIG